MKNNLEWRILAFDKLKTEELYEIIKLRINVFVVEQDCPYPDLDDKDQISYHQMGFLNSARSEKTFFFRISFK